MQQLTDRAAVVAAANTVRAVQRERYHARETAEAWLLKSGGGTDAAIAYGRTQLQRYGREVYQMNCARDRRGAASAQKALDNATVALTILTEAREQELARWSR